MKLGGKRYHDRSKWLGWLGFGLTTFSQTKHARVHFEHMRYVDFGHTTLKYIAWYGTGYVWKVLYDIQYHVVGNFHEVQIFSIFTTHDQNTKIRTAK